MQVLVTGGAGFIGSNIVDALIEKGKQVIIVDNLSTGKKENINQKAKFYQCDLRDENLAEIFKENDISHVIHHAAQIDVQKSIKDPIFDAQNNILAAINLLENCRKYDVEKIIYASTAAVYGDPDYLPVDEKHPIKAVSAYGISKYTPEHYIKMYSKLYGLKYTIFRYANVYGPRQDPKGEGGVISIFVDLMLAQKRPKIFGDGKQTRDFIHVYDIVEANLAALKKADNSLLNISTNTQSSVNELLESLNQILGSKIKAFYEDARPGDIIKSALANQKAKEQLNWSPAYNLKEGLEQTVNFYQK